MPWTWSFLVASVLCVSLLSGGSNVQSDKGTLPTSRKPIERESLRFEGRSFEQWEADLLTELSVNRRVKALGALSAFAPKGYGAEATAAVMELIGDYNTENLRVWLDSDEKKDFSNIMHAAETVILAAGDAANPVVLRALQGKQRNARLFALYCLRWQWKDRDINFAMATLDRLATDQDKATRESAMEILGSRWGNKGVGEAFARILKEGDREFALGKLPTSEDLDSLVPVIGNVAFDKKQTVRLKAIEVLASRLPKKDVANLLSRVLGEGDRLLVLQVVSTATTDIKPLVAVISRLVRDEEPKIKATALEALGNHFLCDGAAASLERLFKENDAVTRVAILKLLQRYSDNEIALPILLHATQDGDADVRLMGVSLLPVLEGESERKIQQVLARLLMDSDEQVRDLAFKSLSGSNPRAFPYRNRPILAVPELVAILRIQGKRPLLRARMIEFLGSVQTDEKDIVGAIEDAKDDVNDEVRQAARLFLVQRKDRLEAKRRKSED